ncbi:dephospho-CoA kinase [Agrobacterium larrymoorei]|uniref:Dephospho-CoA kinase n=1 Tax=Agrobacterium larrymoorei TaxID=160699 RepID=A0A4D7DJT0_9HYPH|nr:dephospho-CoA kinase [Agrobacterium larrymoorei]QCI96655.1 dephospho-CoA kinase [Agrobacterium larrymoorei]QYA07921.1 dephospho-CoA kinase [Agrobacterium larrymoorei]WHA41290.1 dephospho-CoA kinase [Agrobacterium larrymoorei]
MITIGLTGSIGMGKSTTADLFAQEGVPVCDSDQVVHDLYEGEAVASISSAFPSAVVNGKVDREALSRILRQNPANFGVLENIVHPLVRLKQIEFLAEQKNKGAAFVLLDIPLLFETDAQDRVDVVVVVSGASEIQRQRVLTRAGMTEEKFAMILARQMPDVEKRERADFVIDTGNGIENARDQVRAVLDSLRRR